MAGSRRPGEWRSSSLSWAVHPAHHGGPSTSRGWRGSGIYGRGMTVWRGERIGWYRSRYCGIWGWLTATGRMLQVEGLWEGFLCGWVGLGLGCGWGVGCSGVVFAARWFFRMKVRLGREADRRGGGTGAGAGSVYPPRLVTVVRDLCSAGGSGEKSCGVGRSSGCGWAGSLPLFGSLDEVVVVSLCWS